MIIPDKKCIFASKNNVNMDIDIREIEIGLICANSCQLAGVPMNYRKITAENLHALEKSLKDCPELLAMRPLITIEQNGKFVVLSGNHRLRAAANIGMKTAALADGLRLYAN